MGRGELESSYCLWSFLTCTPEFRSRHTKAKKGCQPIPLPKQKSKKEGIKAISGWKLGFAPLAAARRPKHTHYIWKKVPN